MTRPATLDDVERVVELSNLCSMELTGLRQAEVHRYRNDWQGPTLNPETDLRLVFAADGTLVGYGGVWDAEPHVQIHSWGTVHPAYRGQGIGSYLAAWVEARARQSIPKAPTGARVGLGQGRPVVDTVGREFLLAHGYRLIRHFTKMKIEMSERPPAPVFPTGLTVRTFADLEGSLEQRLRALILAERDIFCDHWGYVEQPMEVEYGDWRHWIEHDPDHDPTLWFLATAGDEIAGVSLCAPKTPEDPKMGYVESLGVRRPWRRQGVALALLHHSFGEFYRRSTFKVALDVDAQSLTGATRLYEKAGMHVDRQEAIYEKELRPGTDLSTQTLSEADADG
jgi:ribosomal protein S18 acetylase RimI-like enzyme